MNHPPAVSIRLLTTLFAAALSASLAQGCAKDKSPSAAGQRTPAARPVSERDARMAWWREARFGMFIHWGLYAVPAGDWNGKTVPSASEWIMQNGAIPVADYEKLKDRFNPVKFDARQWVKVAGDAGMKYLVITSKHHDGFCLWDSKVSDYDVMSTPFKRDILRELADACKADGRVRLCFYHSIMDWHHPDAQSINAPGQYNPGRAYKPNPNFSRYVETYLKPQLKELISGYDPAVLWFDGEWIPEYTEAMGHDIDRYCKGLSPGLIINNRVGKTRQGMAGMSSSAESAGDFGTPEQEIPATGIPGLDWESCMTMNDSWGFKRADSNWKSGRTLVVNLVDIVSKGGNYLLNVGPTAEGEIPPASVERLAQVGQFMKTGAVALHGAGASPFAATRWGRATTRGNTVYLHVLDWPSDGVIDVPLKNNVRAAQLLTDKSRRLEVVAEEDGTLLKNLGARPEGEIDSIIALELAEPPRAVRRSIRAGADGSLVLLAADAKISGKQARLEQKGANPRNIGYWTDAKDTCSWLARLDKPGKYQVELEYSLDPNSKGSVIRIELGAAAVEVKLEPTRNFMDFRTIPVGEVTLSAGELPAALRPVAKPGLAVMDLRRITLKPVK